jgi:hypothetical protein
VERKEDAFSRPWHVTDIGQGNSSYWRILGYVEQLQVALILVIVGHLLILSEKRCPRREFSGTGPFGPSPASFSKNGIARFRQFEIDFGACRASLLGQALRGVTISFLVVSSGGRLSTASRSIESASTPDFAEAYDTHCLAF